MKSPDTHNAVVKTLRQVLQILEENPRFLREYVTTRLDDLAAAVTVESTSPRPSPTTATGMPRLSELLGGQPDRMPEKWKKVLCFIGDKGKAHLDDIMAYAAREHLEIKSEDTLRSQLAEYVRKDWLHRPQNGWFELTETGKKRVGYDLV